MAKYKLSWKDLSWNDFKTYLFALFKAFIPKKKIKNLEDTVDSMKKTIKALTERLVKLEDKS